ncbi:DUF3267 domain-containing protein [Cytobacillus purgationiresistens]|uniref:Cellulose synthase/poly-beta-1,6-N-acetylglucosamine synthase-like glycosyltransferase n=1 Tax=Cytobacillus purgationiresistens TaxID=863449 RepID=A0ABU0ADI1_9BACI|nr:DUF3267 domain-containing protein [Cytobacillus purgationiresistens]MDQ0268939.1 cellulose synthase/poly-beta-1,6-N-acetylglucosamine synthase-like glycosyltransferase [Cytobacillus purgationiresistens]
MTMNCWRAINFTKQYGHLRIMIFSLLTMFFTFIITYIPATYIFVSTTFSDRIFFIFLVALLMIYPLHKLLHYLPVLHMRQKIKKGLIFRSGFYPIITVQIMEPISKFSFLVALLTPSIIINSSLIVLCFMYTQFALYFIILLAYHVGLSFYDMIYVKFVMMAPNHSYIEENADGIEILVTNPD